MPTRVVRIIKGNSDGTLELDLPNREAHAGDTILWHIKKNSNVYSITFIGPKSGAQDIWQTPPALQNCNWEGEISPKAADNTRYDYKIKWISTKTGQEYTYDPIITIKSTGVVIDNAFVPIVRNIINWILSGILFITGISFFILWMMKRKEANRLRKELEHLKSSK